MRFFVSLLVLLAMSVLGFGQEVSITSIASRHRQYAKRLANLSATFTQTSNQSGEKEKTTFDYKQADKGEFLLRAAPAGSPENNEVRYFSEEDGHSLMAIGEFGSQQQASKDKSPNGVGVLPLDFGYTVNGQPLVDVLTKGRFTVSRAADSPQWGKSYLVEGSTSDFGPCRLWLAAEDLIVYGAQVGDDDYQSRYTLTKTKTSGNMRLPIAGVYQLLVDGKAEVTNAFTVEKIALGGVTTSDTALVSKMAPGSKYTDRVAGKRYRVSQGGKLVQEGVYPSPLKKQQSSNLGIMVVSSIAIVLVAAVCYVFPRRSRRT